MTASLKDLLRLSERLSKAELEGANILIALEAGPPNVGDGPDSGTDSPLEDLSIEADAPVAHFLVAMKAGPFVEIDGLHRQRSNGSIVREIEMIKELSSEVAAQKVSRGGRVQHPTRKVMEMATPPPLSVLLGPSNRSLVWDSVV